MKPCRVMSLECDTNNSFRCCNFARSIVLILPCSTRQRILYAHGTQLVLTVMLSLRQDIELCNRVCLPRRRRFSTNPKDSRTSSIRFGICFFSTKAPNSTCCILVKLYQSIERARVNVKRGTLTFLPVSLRHVFSHLCQ